MNEIERICVDKDILDFLKVIYFGDINDPMEAAADRAYRDLNRTIRYKDTPPDKTTDNPDRNDSCRGFLILSYNEQYKVYHARTYKYKGFREYHSVKAVRIEIYI